MRPFSFLGSKAHGAFRRGMKLSEDSSGVFGRMFAGRRISGHPRVSGGDPLPSVCKVFDKGRGRMANHAAAGLACCLLSGMLDQTGQGHIHGDALLFAVMPEQEIVGHQIFLHAVAADVFSKIAAYGFRKKHSLRSHEGTGVVWREQLPRLA